jgi:hypothetical protein
MPWLESTASSIKGNIFNGRGVISEATFKGYSDDMRIHIIRSTVGIMSYMNDEKVYKTFVDSSRCIGNVWYEHNNLYHVQFVLM